ncbi:hypothetical protein V5799_011021 [Amblyomma americanum]|uniref:M13 family peptidase n=1 Tax=Amblyomma americanum TaxID=6943 RepID=A0AAQ4EIE2_AMBAM
MLIIVLLVFLFGKMSPIDGWADRGSSDFCCPHVLEKVYGDVNFRRDPCESVLEYACARRSRSAINERRFGDSPNSAPASDSVSGKPTTNAAGRAIAAYYKACVASFSANESLGRLSARAVLDIATAAPFMPAVRLLGLVFELSLRYGLPSLLDIQLKSSESALATYLIISFPSVAKIPLIKTSVAFQTVKVDALRTANEAMLSNLSLEDVDGFFVDSERAHAYEEEVNTVEALMNIATGITAAQWKDTIEKFTPLTRVSNTAGVPLRVLKRRIAEWIKPGKSQPSSVAMTVVGAAIHLASRLTPGVDKSEHKPDTFCDAATKELRPLWVLNAVGASSPQPLNNAIRAVYWELLRRVLRTVGFSMTKRDRDQLAEKLVKMHMLFPSDVVPAGVPIPVLSQDFAHAYMAARAYMFEARRHRTCTLGVSRDFIGELDGVIVCTTSETLTIPSHIYASLVAINTTEEVLLMPTIGVRLADVIWKAVLSGNWSRKTLTRLRVYEDCVASKIKATASMDAQLETSHWLSLDTSVRASREDDDWHSLVDGSRNVTLSQLFYAMYVQHHFCSGVPIGGSRNFVETALSALIGAYPDFASSFRCRKAPKNEDLMCAQHLSGRRKDTVFI